MREKLIDATLMPFYALGYVAGMVVRGVVIAWQTIRLGWQEGRRGTMGQS